MGRPGPVILARGYPVGGSRLPAGQWNTNVNGTRMKIILAAPRGFCAGVNMAIDSLDLTLQKFGPPVYVYHEIVHNQYVVKTFREKGAVFVDSIDEVPEGSVLLFSAHGVSPEIRQAAREPQAQRARCDLSAGHQSSPGSDQVRQGGLHDHSDRP